MKRSLKLALLIAIFTTLVSCRFVSCSGLKVGGAQVGNQIEPGEIERIEALTRQTIAAMRKETPDELMALFDPGTLDVKGVRQNLRQFYPHYRAAVSHMESDEDYETFQIYRFSNVGVGGLVTTARANDPEPHFLTANLGSRSGAAHIVRLPRQMPSAENSLSLVWIEKEDQLQLRYVHVGPYLIGGKSGPEWYEAAEAGKRRGPVLATWWRYFAADKTYTLMPDLKFDTLNDFVASRDAFRKEIETQWTFPIPARELPNDVVVYGFDMFTGDELLVPVVRFASSLPLADEEAHQAQAEEFLAWLEKEFGGFCSADTEAIHLFAFEELPLDKNRKYPNRGIRLDCPGFGGTADPSDDQESP